MNNLPLVLLLALALPAGAEFLPMQPCPSTPNCVSSLATDKTHQVDAITFEGEADKAWERLASIVSGMKRAKVITSTDDYLHAEVRSALFRFVDDVEFQLDPTAQCIHVRSASRTGRSDLGVNRKRIQTIRVLFRQSDPHREPE